MLQLLKTVRTETFFNGILALSAAVFFSAEWWRKVEK